MQDLWAEFAGEALLTEEAGRGRGLHQRRLTEQAVLADLRAWLLQEYLIPYATSLGATRIFQRCYWIDGLGNTRGLAQEQPPPDRNEAETNKRGRKKTHEQLSTLPPALQPVSRIARQLARLDRPITLQSFLLTGKSGKRKIARENRQQALNGAQAPGTLALPKEGGQLAVNWPEVAPTLLSTLEQSSAVFLLNPLKDGLFRYTDLAPLYQRTAPTELFLWLSHRQIETLLPGLSTTEGAAALTNLLRGDRWRGLLAKEHENQEGIIRGVIELFMQSLRPHFLTVQHVSFPVRTGPIRVENVPFGLLFATRRQDSLYSLNDAICHRTRRLVAESQQGVLNEDWFATRRVGQAATLREALAQEALVFGRTHRVRRWPDLRQHLLLAHFGLYTLQEYDQLITALLARDDVRCEWQKRSPATTEAAIPGNGDLLLWSSG